VSCEWTRVAAGASTVDRESEARDATTTGVDSIGSGGDPVVPPLAGVAVAVLAVSTSAILVELSDAPAVVKALYRVGLTAAALAPVAATRYRSDLRRLGRRDAVGAGAAGVALAVHFAAWFASLDHTSVAASVTLVQAQPVFVAVGAWALLDERVTRRTGVGILVALAGMATMTLLGASVETASAPRPTLGNGLALVAAVAAAMYFLVGRSVRGRVRLVPYVTVVYVACTGVLLIGAVASGVPLVGYPVSEWALFVAMAVGPGLLGHTLLNWALAHLESSVVSVSLLGEPVGSTLLAIVVLNEVPTTVTVVGGLVVLAGIGLAATGRTRPGTGDPPAGRPDRS
jgi:drug/metabolite transporter (DMT)-like permease